MARTTGTLWASKKGNSLVLAPLFAVDDKRVASGPMLFSGTAFGDTATVADIRKFLNENKAAHAVGNPHTAPASWGPQVK